MHCNQVAICHNERMKKKKKKIINRKNIWKLNIFIFFFFLFLVYLLIHLRHFSTYFSLEKFPNLYCYSKKGRKNVCVKFLFVNVVCFAIELFNGIVWYPRKFPLWAMIKSFWIQIFRPYNKMINHREGVQNGNFFPLSILNVLFDRISSIDVIGFIL